MCNECPICGTRLAKKDDYVFCPECDWFAMEYEPARFGRPTSEDYFNKVEDWIVNHPGEEP